MKIEQIFLIEMGVEKGIWRRTICLMIGLLYLTIRFTDQDIMNIGEEIK